jgi:predicted nucleic acid-binding Zn ribbon protein
MRRSNTESLGDIIHQYIQTFGIDKKLDEVKIYDIWPEIVGKEIAQKTRKLQIVNRVLFVYCSSSVARSELIKIRNYLPDELNLKMGIDLIDEVLIR